MEDIIKNLSQKLSVVQQQEFTSPTCINVSVTDLVGVCQELQQNDQLYFDMLSCVTGIDNGEEAGTMEVIYHLYSIPNEQSLMLKVVLVRNKENEALPTIPSVCHIWNAAEWHEREIYDLLGIEFNNHPDLRRILMPADWEGHPLRKDYKNMERYRGMSVVYDRDEEATTTE